MGLRNSPFRRQRFPPLSEDQLRQIAAIPREEMRHTRLVQDWRLVSDTRQWQRVLKRESTSRCLHSCRFRDLPNPLHRSLQALLKLTTPTDLIHQDLI